MDKGLNLDCSGGKFWNHQEEITGGRSGFNQKRISIGQSLQQDGMNCGLPLKPEVR